LQKKISENENMILKLNNELNSLENIKHFGAQELLNLKTELEKLQKENKNQAEKISEFELKNSQLIVL